MELIKNLDLADIKYVDKDGIERIETWVEIIGCEGSYMLSSIGRIKSLFRTFIRSNGFKMTVKEKILKPTYNIDGYVIFRIKFNDGFGYSLIGHRLVAQYFIPNPDNLPEVNHRNFIRHDNRFENLQWNTHLENVKYSIDAGKYVGSKGVKNGMAKLTEKEVLEIRNHFKLNPLDNKGEMAKKYNISRAVMSKVINRNSWRHL